MPKSSSAVSRRSGKGTCLGVSGRQHQADEPTTGYNLGHDANKQCRLQFHHKSQACKIAELCRELWCLDDEEKCITNSIPAAQGTPCRNHTHLFHGHCYRGFCERAGYQPEVVDGGWSAWSGYSECSRTCGGGVMYQERFCNNPKPDHGGQFCVGDRVRYKSCNIKQNCSADSEDFRKMQCSEYNTIPFRSRYFNWVPFTGSQGNACALNCMAEGFNFYTERAHKVADGTACYPDRLDMCINGECHLNITLFIRRACVHVQHVGCDGELGSAAEEDKCRVCAGDGSSCHTISGMVDKSLPKGAYQEILKIPSGAMHIQVQEAYESHNYLALKSEGGPFYINGDWTIDWPRKFTVAGTVFHYERQNDAPEIMRAVGPTSENLVVMLLMQEDNQGVQYEYNMPYSASPGNPNVTQYTWTHSAWTDCSHSCGKGISTSEAVCVHKYRQTIVDDGFCFPQPKPSHHYKHCNQEPCPADWELGEWSRCSQTCGGGRKARTVVCRQRISQEEVVTLDDTECPGQRPEAERQCKRSNCPPMWVAEDWTECSKRCGRGEMVRHVYCMTSDRGMYLDDSECDGTNKPATMATCIKMACPQPKWVLHEWSECQGRCDEGWQRRQVDCINHDGDVSDDCDINSRPVDARKCNMNCDEELGTHDECVDNYNFAYCPLVLKFRFCDREYFLKMCCKTCQISGALGIR
ncbi:ATS6-like protein [Mya arenaria]|uniref:ATS6-like protein n=1 Tax=Mya arenaria TaxID=6604 RepID=A0ABY7FPX9_MYAAR|nr:ATS6-like protein [Mya arenaria]